MGRYIISTNPMLRPPEGKIECTEATHWYLAKNGWTDKKPRAFIFEDSSSAVARIGELRRRVDHVEFTLVPIDGDVFSRRMGR